MPAGTFIILTIKSDLINKRKGPNMDSQHELQKECGRLVCLEK